ESVDDVRCGPCGAGAAVRVRGAVIAAATEVATAGQAEVVREARIDVAIVIVLSEAPGIREIRHVRRAATTGCQDGTEVVVLHEDDDQIIKIRPGGGRSPGHDLHE